jgi:hypothetical protein
MCVFTLYKNVLQSYTSRFSRALMMADEESWNQAAYDGTFCSSALHSSWALLYPSNPHCILYHFAPSLMNVNCAGATAWDAEDGDLSMNVLSCAPSSCMPFNCPGHESFRKGLSGCGIDTVNSPVDNLFLLTFTVSDFSTPPATSYIHRLITIISPCAPGETYCPDLAKPPHSTGEHACGTTDCITRAAILVLVPVERSTAAPSIEFSSAVPVAAVSSTPPGSQPSTAFVYSPAHPMLSQARVHTALCF